ncbi:MAG: type II toxin-antitoxin system RelE/ParE family toxin [Alkalinema sp. RU_4_3]|nr:type II toxin-antitoxin system RelE/ParE family toxin [Alkalinema sp. RU_4_3]
MNQLRINVKADLDIDAEASFIAEKFGIERGVQFYDACETTFNQLLTYPKIGKVREFSNISIEVRRWQVKGFAEYLIFYRLLADGQSDDQSLTIEVLRIVHGARDLEVLFQGEFSVE